MVDQRRCPDAAAACRHGRTVRARRLALAAWTIFVTNIPAEPVTLPEALLLGRTRWQLELLVRLWKPHGRIDESRRQQPGRVGCAVYATWLAVVVAHWVLLVPRWAYPDRSLPTAARLIQKPARQVASAIGAATAVETALDVSTRGVATCCRMPRRKTHPHTYPLLRDTRIYG